MQKAKTESEMEMRKKKRQRWTQGTHEDIGRENPKLRITERARGREEKRTR